MIVVDFWLNAGLSKHSAPCFCNFCCFFFLILVFSDPIQSRMWFVALCSGGKGQYVCSGVNAGLVNTFFWSLLPLFSVFTHLCAEGAFWHWRVQSAV